jgi:hypothetical protein
MHICLLSPEEAGRLTNWGIWPQCKQHRHIPKKEAAALAANGELRFVDDKSGQPTSMVTRVRIRIWKPVPTAGGMGLRTWGLAPSD